MIAKLILLLLRGQVIILTRKIYKIFIPSRFVSTAPEDVHIMSMNNTFMGDLQPIRPKFMPTAIPKDLSERIMKVHDFAPAYWVSQMVKYLYKLRPEVTAMLNKRMIEMGFKSPIVGIHVRRSDKVTTREGLFHYLWEYMDKVDEYYNQLEMKQKVSKRRVYLATDDAGVIQEARTDYPHYEFIVNENAAKKANDSRYSEESLKGVLLDIHLLSRSDHLICTFSSHICRTSYETMQYLFPDASHKYTSLEALWEYHEANPAVAKTVVEYDPGYPEDFKANIGDLLEIFYWTNISYGFYSVNHTVTNITGMIPVYRIEHIWELVDFPTYPEAELDNSIQIT